MKYCAPCNGYRYEYEKPHPHEIPPYHVRGQRWREAMAKGEA